jgi:hypothetical protein
VHAQAGAPQGLIHGLSRPSPPAGATWRIVKVRLGIDDARWDRPQGNCSHPGGAAGIRTPDLRRARAALSRLSYGPPSASRRASHPSGVGAPGLEPGTSALSGPRSNHLSYAPMRHLITTTVPVALCPRRSARKPSKPPESRRTAPVSSPSPLAPLPAPQPLTGEEPEARCPDRDGSPETSLTRLDTLQHSRGRPERQLPRKEVIQPQLPLRLPCYDFVPITSPALDGCLPGGKPPGLAPRLQALPAFVT